MAKKKKRVKRRIKRKAKRVVRKKKMKRRVRRNESPKEKRSQEHGKLVDAINNGAGLGYELDLLIKKMDRAASSFGGITRIATSKTREKQYRAAAQRLWRIEKDLKKMAKSLHSTLVDAGRTARTIR